MFGIPIFAVLTDEYPELYETYAEGRMLIARASWRDSFTRWP